MSQYWEPVNLEKYCLNEKCATFAVDKTTASCPACKTPLNTHCPKCQKPLGSYNKHKSYGCQHCGHMFKNFR